MNTVYKVFNGTNAGFFSCCSVRLYSIIRFFNENGYLPNTIDSSQLFQKYKNMEGDLTNYYFEEKSTDNGGFEKCSHINDVQFTKYNELEFEKLSKYINTYFTPSDLVNSLINELETKYNIDYENTCSIFYRGNDKFKEASIGNYSEFFSQADSILENNKKIKFLVQTDETQFLEEFSNRYQNVFYFTETPHIKKSQTSVHDVLPIQNRSLFAAYLLAATIIVSKSKFLITHSGNCGLWSILYRGNTNNVHQYLDHSDDKVNFKGWLINKDFL